MKSKIDENKISTELINIMQLIKKMGYVLYEIDVSKKIVLLMGKTRFCKVTFDEIYAKGQELGL